MRERLDSGEGERERRLDKYNAVGISADFFSPITKTTLTVKFSSFSSSSCDSPFKQQQNRPIWISFLFISISSLCAVLFFVIRAQKEPEKNPLK